MDARVYQRTAHQTGETYLHSNSMMHVIYPLLGIAGETGELIEKIKKVCRNSAEPESLDDFLVTLQWQPDLADSIQKEVGDILWYIAEFCTRMNMSLSVVMEMNLKKILDRKNRGVIRGEGDSR